MWDEMKEQIKFNTFKLNSTRFKYFFRGQDSVEQLSFVFIPLIEETILNLWIFSHEKAGETVPIESF